MNIRFKKPIVMLLSILLIFTTINPACFAIDRGKEQTVVNLENEQQLQEKIKQKLDTISVPFVENKGQVTDEKVKYIADTIMGKAYVTDEGIEYAIHNDGCPALIKERFHGGGFTKIKGINKAKTKINYFKGSDKAKWLKDVTSYDEITYGRVYDSIEVNLKAFNNNIEKIFEVKPGGNPKDIQVEIIGTTGLKVTEEDELEIQLQDGSVKMSKPVAYQQKNGKKQQVPVEYTINDNTYGFEVGEYDKTLPLVIDPFIASTFFGGSGNDELTSMAIDKDGNIYIAGHTKSEDFPTKTGSYSGGEDVFVSKLDKDLKTLLASTYIGGSKDDNVNSLAVDASGNIFITGYTKSSGMNISFPITEDSYQSETATTGPGSFITKLNGDLDNIIASMFLDTGKGSTESINCIALDSQDNVFVAGRTDNSELFSDVLYGFSGEKNGFVAKFDNELGTLKSSTYLGGGGILHGAYRDNGTSVRAVTIDNQNNVYVTGSTCDENFPTTDNAFCSEYNEKDQNWPGDDAFVTKLNNNLDSLISSAFLGGKSGDVGVDIEVDTDGSVFVTGMTTSVDFPVGNEAYQKNLKEAPNTKYYDIFISRLNNDLSKLLAGTYIGGTNREDVYGMALDEGSVYITGSTTGGYPTTDDSSGYIVISKLNKGLTTLEASTALGVSKDEGRAIAVKDRVYVAGSTLSSNFPVTDGVYQELPNSKGYEAKYVFVSELSKDLMHTRAVKVTSNKWRESVGLDQTIDITVQFDAAVYLDIEDDNELPTLKLNVGEDRYATYDSGTGTNKLTFKYTVEEGDNAEVLNYTSIDALDLRDNKAMDKGGGKADITLPDPYDPSDSLQYREIRIDTTAPEINKVTSEKQDGIYGPGAEIPIKVQFSEPVTVEESPQLKLNTEPERYAEYIGGSGPSTLMFMYTVEEGDSATKLNYASENALTLNGGSIKDGAGNDAVLTLPKVDSENSLAGSKNIIIDSKAAYVTNVSSTMENGHYGNGTVIPIDVTFSGDVTVEGTPKLKLNIEPMGYAEYKEGSGTSVLTFEYTVGEHDNSNGRLNYTSVDSLVLNEGNIKGKDNEPASLNLPKLESKNSLAETKEIYVDTDKPTLHKSLHDVISVTPGSGTYGPGTEISIKIKFTEAVLVEGQPYLELNIPDRRAVYAGGSDSDTLEFVYTVEEGDNQPDGLDYPSTDSLKLGEDGSIRDLAGNKAVLKLPTFTMFPANPLKNVKIDAESPVWPEGSTLEVKDITDTSLKLEWPKATDNDKVAKYLVYCDGELIHEATGTIFTDPATNYTVQNLIPATEYGFEIKAVDAAGNESVEGLETTAKTTGESPIEDTEPPVWKKGSIPTAESIKLNELTLVWDKDDVTDNVGVTGFKIYQKDGEYGEEVEYDLIAEVDSNTTSYVVTGLESTTSYKFKVEAVDAAGNESKTDRVLKVMTEIPDLIISVDGDIKEELLLKDLSELEVDESWPPKETAAPIVRRMYTAMNNYGTKRFYAVEGIRISYLIENLGLTDDSILTFVSGGMSETFTKAQLEEPRYYYPDDGEPTMVEPLLAYMSDGPKDGSQPSFDNMDYESGLRLYFGQKDRGEVLAPRYLKEVFHIKITQGESGEPEEKPKYELIVEEDDIYEIEKTESGMVLTVNEGIEGFKYFGVSVKTINEHPGEETVVFTHLRDGKQTNLNSIKTDFDVQTEEMKTAQSGFNVKPGDVVKIYIVDDLTNDTKRNPVILL